LFANETDDVIKLADFGLSRHFEVADIMHTRAGSAYYMAPEVLKRNYSEACDVWSVGCIVYVMLSGFPPFYADSEPEVFRLILNRDLEFPSPDWDLVSDSAVQFVSTLLVKEPAQRPTAADCLQLPWVADANASPTSEISSRTLLALKSFVNASKFKKKLLSEVSKKLSVEDLAQLRKEFDTLDLNHDGVLSSDEILKAVNRMDSSLISVLLPLQRQLKTSTGFSLDWDSFLKAVMSRREFLRHDWLAEIFARLDTDHSGKLSVAEITNALGADKNDPKLKEEIERYDLNRDGEIDFDEVVALLQSREEA